MWGDSLDRDPCMAIKLSELKARPAASTWPSGQSGDAWRSRCTGRTFRQLMDVTIEISLSYSPKSPSVVVLSGSRTLTLNLSSLFLLSLNSLTKHAEVTNLVRSSIDFPCGRAMPEHANNMFSSAQSPSNKASETTLDRQSSWPRAASKPNGFSLKEIFGTSWSGNLPNRSSSIAHRFLWKSAIAARLSCTS